MMYHHFADLSGIFSPSVITYQVKLTVTLLEGKTLLTLVSKKMSTLQFITHSGLLIRVDLFHS